MMCNARFGPLTLLMTLRVKTSKAMTNLRDYFTFQSMTLTSDSRLRLFLSELIYHLDSLTNYIYNEYMYALSKKSLILNNN